MKKRIMHSLLIICTFFSSMHCMELNKDKNEKKDNSKDTIIIVDSEPNSGTKIPTLNLTDTSLNTSSTNLKKYTSKRPKLAFIDSHNALKEKVVQTTKTHRSQTERSQQGAGSTGQEPSTRKSNIQMLTELVDDSNLIKEISKQQHYTEAEVWDILKHASPTLYNFGQSHKMTLDTMVLYSKFLREMDVTPNALLEFVNQHHDLSNLKPADFQLQGFANIQKKNPEQYEKMVLEIIKAINDQEEQGAQASVALTNTHGAHIGILEDKVKSQNTTIFAQAGGLVIFFFTTVVPTIIAVYQKITEVHCPTNTSRF